MDLYEIASAPLERHRLVLVCSATRPPDPPALQLASFRVVENGLLAPKSPLPLDPASLALAVKLVDQAEEVVGSGLAPIPDAAGIRPGTADRLVSPTA